MIELSRYQIFCFDTKKKGGLAMSGFENDYPYIRMEDVETAVWKRLKENADYRTIQKRFDDMLETIGRADEKKVFVYDLEKPSA